MRLVSQASYPLALREGASQRILQGGFLSTQAGSDKISIMAQRKKSSPAMKQDQAMRRVIALAEQVFENKEDAREWLSSRQYGLGGAIPIDMVQTDATKAREVEQLLIRIDHGVIS